MIPIAILIFLYFFLVLLLVALIDMYIRAYYDDADTHFIGVDRLAGARLVLARY